MLNRLYPFNFIDDLVYASDALYVYGQASNRFAVRWSLAEINAGAVATNGTGYDFGVGNEVKGCWTVSSGRKFYMVEVTATGQYSLWRSNFTEDSSWAAGSFTKIFDFGNDSGSPIVDVLVLQDGFVEVEIGGVKSILIYEYNVNQTRTLGGANDPVRILQSTDDGATFSPLITFNLTGYFSARDECAQWLCENDVVMTPSRMVTFRRLAGKESFLCSKNAASMVSMPA